MNIFCSKCGTKLDVDTQLCPVCDAEELNRRKQMPKFCTKCGSRLDVETGLCPICDISETNTEEELQCTKEEIQEEKQQDISETQDNFIELTEKVNVDERVIVPEVNENVFQKEVINNDNPSVSTISYTNAYEESDTRSNEVVEKPDIKTKVKKKKKGTVVFEVILTVLLSLFLFVTTTLALANMTLRNSVTPNSINTMLDAVDVFDVIEMVYDGSKNDVVESLNKYYDSNMKASDINRFFSKSSAKEDISELLSDYINDFINDEDEFEFTAEDMFNFLRKNKQEFSKLIGMDVSYDQLWKIAEDVVNEDVRLMLESGTASSVKDNDYTVYTSINFVLSEALFTIMVIISLLFIGVMIKNNFSQAAVGTGVTFMIIGGIFSASALVSRFIPQLWELLPFETVILKIFGGFLYLNIGTFTSLFCLGLVLLIVRKIIIAVVKKIRMKKAA